MDLVKFSVKKDPWTYTKNFAKTKRIETLCQIIVEMSNGEAVVSLDTAVVVDI